jgi:hypothetical protein
MTLRPTAGGRATPRRSTAMFAMIQRFCAGKQIRPNHRAKAIGRGGGDRIYLNAESKGTPWNALDW